MAWSHGHCRRCDCCCCRCYEALSAWPFITTCCKQQCHTVFLLLFAFAFAFPIAVVVAFAGAPAFFSLSSHRALFKLFSLFLHIRLLFMGTATLITLFFGELTFRLLLQQQEQRTATSKYKPSTHNNSQVQFGKVSNYRCAIAGKKKRWKSKWTHFSTK